MTGVLALAVGTMLSASRNAIHRSADKIAYEEAYQTALAGTHVARGWLIDPKLAGKMAGNGAGPIETDLKALIDKAIVMNDKVKADVAQKIKTDLYGPSSRYTQAGFSLGATVSGGRKVLYTFKGAPVVSLVNDPGGKLFQTNLFKETPQGGHKASVQWIRLTTPGVDNETSASLRECTFIIEAKGVAEYAGVKKERVVQQRILIKPNDPSSPLISATEAILTDGAISAHAMSSSNVHWGAVLAKGNISIPFINAIAKVTEKVGKNMVFKGYNFGLNQAQKANIAGLALGDSGKNKLKNSTGPDTKLHWMAGTAGKLYAGQHGGDYMFQDVPNVPASGEFDFFKQLFAGALNTGPTPLSLANFTLASEFAAVGTSIDANDPSKGNGLYRKLPDGTFTGALVQGSPAVDQRIDDFFGTMTYDTLKAYALAHNGYYTYNGSTLRDAAGKVATLPKMTPGMQDTLAAGATQDRLLFIDSAAGTDAQPFTNAIGLPDFWKGVIYVNGPLKTSGAGSSPEVVIRSPEQFAAYRATGASGSNVGNVLVDGIVIVNGSAELGANGAIYGTLGAKGGVTIGSSFSIYYNSANGEGRLKDTSTGAQPYTLIAGKLYETKLPPS